LYLGVTLLRFTVDAPAKARLDCLPAAVGSNTELSTNKLCGLAAALPLLPPALQHARRLTVLHIRLPGMYEGSSRPPLQRALQHTFPGLCSLLESNAALRKLTLAFPSYLQEATEAYLPRLEAAAMAAPRQLRGQLLLGLHARAGRGSLLQLLPREVLAHILELAAPLQPCEIELKWG
jgi:hypothetical protein